jgi:hypothetical protein
VCRHGACEHDYDTGVSVAEQQASRSAQGAKAARQGDVRRTRAGARSSGGRAPSCRGARPHAGHRLDVRKPGAGARSSGGRAPSCRGARPHAGQARVRAQPRTGCNRSCRSPLVSSLAKSPCAFGRYWTGRTRRPQRGAPREPPTSTRLAAVRMIAPERSRVLSGTSSTREAAQAGALYCV